ncbi:MAG TPA: dioxygenase [Candidatus Saccharimonadales bacterium]|jgi:hydroxyquinol 1,2-dioxygenase|nr:dioxygenase [Candidatus Saccharimonadales bacterium]
MIIENLDQVTQAVLEETKRTPDPRSREIIESLVRHLHGFIKETRLTEKELDTAINYMIALGQLTTESHNEVRLMCGSLGVSTLVCLMNNGPNAATESSANMLGPFWRTDSPRTPNGGSLLRSETSGPALFFKGWVRDQNGNPIAGAEVDVWHASPCGLYENQDPEQAEMNLRGKFTTDANGEFGFQSIKPTGYPIPVSGPVGALLNAQRRHNFRPAHLHFLIYKPGYKTVTSQIYSPDDPHLNTDCQFGVTRALIGRYEVHENEAAPAPGVTGPWYSLQHTFIVQPGESWLPTPPVSAKATHS